MIPSIKVDNFNGISVVNIISGSGNKIENSLSDFSNTLFKETGLIFLTHEYFYTHVDCSSNVSDWVKFGTPLSLASIYQNQEYRREAILNEVKERLGKYNKILLLGGPGVSKSIILMEIICDFLKNSPKLVVLYNLNSQDGVIKNLDQIERTIIDLLNGEHQVLIVVDDCHSTNVSAIFLLIKRVEEFSPERRKKVKFLLAAREPDLTNATDGMIFNDINVIESIENIRKATVFTKIIVNFAPDEVKEFVVKYNDYIPKIHKDKSVENFSQEIYRNTDGYPIMVKFFVMNKGLDFHVLKMYSEYVMDNNHKVITNRFELLVLNALYDISDHNYGK